MDDAIDDEGSRTGLPASLEVAWGVRERPHKGPRPGLSLDQILDAAIGVAAPDGLPAVSMSRVAAELGASTMALYRYVSSKDDLLALMRDRAYGRPSAPPDPDEGWRDGLSRWAWDQLAQLRRHPWVLRIPITSPPALPNQVAWMEEGLRCLGDTPLEEGAKLGAILLVSGYVRESATLELDLRTAFQAADSTARQVSSSYGRLLATLTDAERFPALHAVLDAGVFDAEEGDDELEPDQDDEFVFGLERILDGIAVLVRAPA